MKTSIVRHAFVTTLLIGSAASWASGFPVASGEFSAVDAQPSAVASAPRPGSAVAPSTQASSGRTRAEVRAELEWARCRGELPFDGETGRTYRDMFPGQYPQPQCR